MTNTYLKLVYYDHLNAPNAQMCSMLSVPQCQITN